MKKWLYIIIGAAALAAAIAGLYFSGYLANLLPSEKAAAVSGAKMYTCPMHPTYTSDRPGECPICGMTLVPVEEDAESAQAHKGKAVPHRAAIRVTETQRQVIGVKIAEVTKRSLTKEIRTVGTVAYDPGLAVAQKEYLTARRLGDTSLKKAAEERLILMGMSKEQIRKLARKGRIQKNLYLPGPKGKAWIYSTIYETDLPYVKVGQEVDVYIPQSEEETFVGVIAAMDPVVDMKTRSINVRSEVEDPKGILKPNMYVDAYIKTVLGARLSIPTAALMWSDKAHFVFVDEGKGRLVPHKIKIGARTEDFVEITDGLNSGDKVVISPNFLIDAESQLKATLRSMSGGGEHRHDH